jgi:membrane protein implicated in regulation of membrane protease activity
VNLGIKILERHLLVKSRDLYYVLGVWIAVGVMVLDRPVEQPVVEWVQVMVFVALTVLLAFGVWRTIQGMKQKKEREASDKDFRSS